MRTQTRGPRLILSACVLGALLSTGCPKSGGGGEPSPTPGPSEAPAESPGASAKPSAKPSPTPVEKRFQRSYALTLKAGGSGLADSSTTHVVHALRRPRGTDERFAVEVEGGGGYEVALDGAGEFKGGSDAWLNLLLHSLVETPGLKGRGEARNLYLPEGGWLRQEHKLDDSPPSEFAGRLGEGFKVSGRLRGERASGEPFRGTVAWEHWVDRETGELLAVRARVQLQYKDHGVRKVSLELLPQGAPKRDLAPGDWFKGALKEPLEVELGGPLVGSLLLASSVAVAAKPTPRLFAPVAPFALTLGALAARAPAAAPAPESGQVVAKREEPARTYLAYLPAFVGGSYKLTPMVFEDGADRVVVIESNGRRRAVYADDALWGQAQEGQELAVGSASGVDPAVTSVPTSSEVAQLEGADDQGKATIER